MADNVVATAAIVVKAVKTRETVRHIQNVRRNLGRLSRPVKRANRRLITMRSILFALERGSFRIWRAMSSGLMRVWRLVRNVTLALAGMTALLAGAALKKAASFEKLVVQMAVLKGSTKEAQAQMEDLLKFSAKTPFRFEDVAGAAKNFQLMGGEVLNTMENIKMFGDAAAFAKAGYNFEDIALWIGRLHSELERGSKAIGKVTLGLMRAGILSGQARGEMERMAKDGATKESIWKVLTDDMKKFKDGADLLSRTLSGKFSTMLDNFSLALKTLGDALAPIAKFWMDAVIKKLQQLSNDGSLKNWSKMVGERLKAATEWFRKFGKWLEENWPRIWENVQRITKTVGENLGKIFKAIVKTALVWFGLMVPGVKSIFTGLILFLAGVRMTKALMAVFESAKARKIIEAWVQPLLNIPVLLDGLGDPIGDKLSLVGIDAQLAGLNAELESIEASAEIARTAGKAMDKLGKDLGLDKILGPKSKDTRRAEVLDKQAQSIRERMGALVEQADQTRRELDQNPLQTALDKWADVSTAKSIKNLEEAKNLPGVTPAEALKSAFPEIRKFEDIWRDLSKTIGDTLSEIDKIKLKAVLWKGFNVEIENGKKGVEGLKNEVKKLNMELRNVSGFVAIDKAINKMIAAGNTVKILRDAAKQGGGLQPLGPLMNAQRVVGTQRERMLQLGRGAVAGQLGRGAMAGHNAGQQQAASKYKDGGFEALKAAVEIESKRKGEAKEVGEKMASGFLTILEQEMAANPFTVFSQ